MISRRAAVIWGGLALVLAVVNIAVIKKEHLRRSGRPMLLDLAPRDPRSLIEGDYMSLDYAVGRAARERLGYSDQRRHGTLVVTVDGNGLASFARVAGPGEPLGSNERLLRFYQRGARILVGPDAFYFQEGQADVYSRARFADVRVDDRGEVALLGLVDAQHRPLSADGNTKPDIR